MTDQNFNDEQFVYVDPELRLAIGAVEWDSDGNAIPKQWPRKEREHPSGGKEKLKVRRQPHERFYPWGAYKTVSKIYRLQGKAKEKELDRYIPLENAIGKLQEEPYWN